MFSDSRVHKKVKVVFLFVETETAETEIRMSEPLCLFCFLLVCLFIDIFIFLRTLTIIEKKI